MQLFGARLRGVLGTLYRQYKIMTSNSYGLIGFWVVAFFFFVAVFAPLIAPYPIWEMQYDAETGQLAMLQSPSWQFVHPKPHDERISVMSIDTVSSSKVGAS